MISESDVLFEGFVILWAPLEPLCSLSRFHCHFPRSVRDTLNNDGGIEPGLALLLPHLKNKVVHLFHAHTHTLLAVGFCDIHTLSQTFTGTFLPRRPQSRTFFHRTEPHPVPGYETTTLWLAMKPSPYGWLYNHFFLLACFLCAWLVTTG